MVKVKQLQSKIARAQRTRHKGLVETFSLVDLETNVEASLKIDNSYL